MINSKTVKKEISSKERLLIAIQGGKPDRIPVCPDISNMIPCRMTGKTFEKIYFYDSPSLGDAYTHAVKYFGFDGWYQYWQPKVTWKNHHGMDLIYHEEICPLSEGRYQKIVLCKTSSGTLRQCFTSFHADPPSPTEKFIKNIKTDLPLFVKINDANIADVDWTGAKDSYEKFGNLGIWGLWVAIPGLHQWIADFDGGIEAVVAAITDVPDLMDELAYIQHRRAIEFTKRLLDAPIKLDFLLIGASGLLTLSSPGMFIKYSLPTIREITRLCKQANLPTMLHACGKSKYLLETFVKETDLDCFNPVEKPPMGDLELLDARKIVGKKITLMGNLHTTDIMLRGSVEDVKREARQAIMDAGQDGGFILSTGDQCGRDTPDENIVAMIHAAHEFTS